MIPKLLIAVVASFGLALPAAAQRLDVSVMMYETDGQAAGCGFGRVARLNPRGD